MKIHAIALALAVMLLVSACGTGNATAEVPDDEPEVPSCTDSDEGIKQLKKGYVTGYDAEGRYYDEVPDKCLPPFLHEYYCEDGIVKSRNIRCQVCDKGRCAMVIPT